MTISQERIERAAAYMYGKNWDGPEDKRPGEKMKEVWRSYARLALEADAPVMSDISDAMVEAALKAWFGDRNWDMATTGDNNFDAMRSALRAALDARLTAVKANQEGKP